MSEKIFNLETNQRYKWVDEIRQHIPNDMSNDDIIQFCLSYTLQALRKDEINVFNEFKWNGEC